MSSADTRVLSDIKKTSCLELARGLEKSNLNRKLCGATIILHFSLASLSGLT